MASTSDYVQLNTDDPHLHPRPRSQSTGSNLRQDPNREGVDNLSHCEENVRSSSMARMGATINMVSTAIGGGGMFGNIFGASQLGIVGFVIVTFISATFTLFTIQFLCMASQISKRYSCYALSQQFMGGKKGDLITKLFIIFGNWSFCINIIQIFADFMEYILPIWTQTSNASFFVSREFAVILGILFIFPFITVQNIKNLENLSGIFVFFAVAILIVIMMNAFYCITLGEISTSIQYFNTNFNAIFRGLPPITWCWTIQFNVLPVYMTLNESNRNKQMQSVSWWTVSLLFIYYVLFGISTMITWGNRINDDFITNLDYNNKNYVFYLSIELSTVTQFIMVIVTFASIPIFAFEARVNLHYILTDIYWCCFVPILQRIGCYYYHDTIDNNDIENERSPLLSSSPDTQNNQFDILTRSYEETSTSRVMEGSFLIATAALFALMVENLNWSLSIVGATYGAYIAYFVPSIVYLRAIWNQNNLSRKHRYYKYMAFVIFTYGIIVCVLGIMEVFLEALG
mmetsp:Transcript_69880/g.62668  ORF Transcript_69880/g.62668 Transcript_69880/m.62668 type:complete len:515 (+) Transcript_69880:71-1615(+)